MFVRVVTIPRLLIWPFWHPPVYCTSHTGTGSSHPWFLYHNSNSSVLTLRNLLPRPQYSGLKSPPDWCNEEKYELQWNLSNLTCTGERNLVSKQTGHWGEKSCVEIDRSLGREILCRNRQVTGERNLVSKQTGCWITQCKKTEKMVKGEWKSISVNTGKQITQVLV